MPVITYDYLLRPYLYKDKLTPIYSPIIPIQLSAQHEIYPHSIQCLVDSGADHNLMPAELGEYFALPIRKGRRLLHRGIGGIEITAFIHPVTLYVGGYKLQTDVHFSYEHKLPLLGRYGFFRFFKQVTFHEQELALKLTY